MLIHFLLLDLAKFDGAVEGGGFRAGEGVRGVVAGQGLLVKDGAVAAHKGPLSVLDDLAKLVLDGQADVEDLAVVVNVGIVAIGLVLTGEGLNDAVGEDGVRVGGELVPLALVLGEGQSYGQDGGGAHGVKDLGHSGRRKTNHQIHKKVDTLLIFFSTKVNISQKVDSVKY